MAGRHVSVPKSFSDGDVSEWLQRFDICSKANEWNAATQALKLPTLLEGEALAIWLELATEDQEDIKKAKEALVEKMTPAAFLSLDVFHRRVLQPGEALAVFIHDLKKLLGQAMPNLEAAARDQLLLHQFLAGLPATVSRQLRAVGEAKSLQSALERARLLMAMDNQVPVAAVSSGPDPVERLTEQVTRLTEQVAALSTSSRNTERREGVRCFVCNRLGHVRRECPNRQQRMETRRCFKCGEQGHLANDCYQGNDQGAPARGSRYPQTRQ